VLLEKNGVVMPHFYFHVRHGRVTVLDQEGAELANTALAKAEAKRRASEIVRRHDCADGGRIIVDDEWQTIFEFAF
jgi:hypothetical protein